LSYNTYTHGIVSRILPVDLYTNKNITFYLLQDQKWRAEQVLNGGVLPVGEGRIEYSTYTVYTCM
jgi:hypothetical protein